MSNPNQPSKESEALESIFVDQRKLAIEIALEAKDVFSIDNTECIPILPYPTSELKSWAHLLVELATAYICYIGKHRDSASLSREVLMERCRLKSDVLRARLSELRRDRYVRSTDEGEMITTHGLLAFRDFIRELKLEHSSEEGL